MNEVMLYYGGWVSAVIVSAWTLTIYVRMKRSEEQLLETSLEPLARDAYEAYCRVVGNKTWDSRPCPKWHELTPRIRDGWLSAAEQTALTIFGRKDSLTPRGEDAARYVNGSD